MKQTIEEHELSARRHSMAYSEDKAKGFQAGGNGRKILFAERKRIRGLSVRERKS